MMTHSQIILINGPSSAGKSTLAAEVQSTIDHPFLKFSFDLFIDTSVLPMARIRSKTFDWKAMRPHVMSGYINCLEGLASAGNHLIIDHIFESAENLNAFVTQLGRFDVFLVGVHCSIEELERRERARGNRRIGEARADLEFVHTFTEYDLEIDAEQPLEENVGNLIEAWKNRTFPSQFQTLFSAIKEPNSAPAHSS